jgi:hypothetical protein
MGVRITDADNVALYCSTTGVAFSPVFMDYMAAEDFLEWLQKDARLYTEAELLELKARWIRWSEEAS